MIHPRPIATRATRALLVLTVASLAAHLLDRRRDYGALDPAGAAVRRGVASIVGSDA